MLIWLLLMLVVLAVSLIVLLWAGTFFFQGYIYTEPSPGIHWQAPAAAAVLTLGFTIWCLTIAFNAKATPRNIPINTIHEFTPRETMAEFQGRPAPKIWAIKLDRKKTGADKDGEKIAYELKRGDRGEDIYKTKSVRPTPWQPDNVVAIEVEKPDGTTMRFDLAPTPDGGNREFVSSDGWVLTEKPGAGGGPTGEPTKFRFLRLFLNLFFNGAHLVAWFLCLWVILRFQWTHALGFAVILWTAFTLLFLPMMLGYAGLVAANRQAPTALLSAMWTLA